MSQSMPLKPKKSLVCPLLAVSMLLSCVSNKALITKSQLSPQQLRQLEMGQEFIKNKNFLKAVQIYDSLSYSLKDSPAQILSLYNAGVAHRLAGNCPASLDRFRWVLQKSAKKFPEFKARSLLEISFVYECLGQNALSLSSLKDLEKVLSALSWTDKEILYPARLSLAWAKNGDSKQAKAYKSLSLNKLIEYQKSLNNKDKLNEEISRLFYLMGKSYSHKNTLKAENFIPSLFYHQIFLLQSLFLNNKQWSVASQKELSRLFEQLFYVLSQTPNKAKYKKILENTLKAGSMMVKNEKNPTWQAFYQKLSQKTQDLVSKI